LKHQSYDAWFYSLFENLKSVEYRKNYKMKYLKYIFLSGLCLSLVAGCGTGKPDSIPDLFPATVTIKKGTVAVADATVIFTSTGNNSGSWSVSGTTDSNGIAKMNTTLGSWSGHGVPSGEYKIFINKAPVFTSVPMPTGIDGDEAAKQAYEQEQAKKKASFAKEIPSILTLASSTPLKLAVTSGSSAELTVDVSEYEKNR
jgi:hypothetical protein